MTLYEGRISQKPAELMVALNRSLPVDIRLLPYDLRTNLAWARELMHLGVYTQEEFKAVEAGLAGIAARSAAGEFEPLPPDEDVHTLVERLLTEMLGETGRRIHTGRSRNDQVVCDFRLFMLDAVDRLRAETRNLVRVLRRIAAEHVDTRMAGTTHLQPAQLITLGHYLLSLVFGLMRDEERLVDARGRIGLCPLGSGALAGSGFPVDRAALARAMGFAGVMQNSIDAVSDRDMVQELSGACSLLCGRLSRYAEDFVLWSSPAFGYLRLSQAFSTGSSMMPQKRNPDSLELIRAMAARVIGRHTGLLVLTKGLPMTYAKDLQEDKAALFDVVDTSAQSLALFAGALDSASFFPTAMRARLTADLLATDLADALVQAGVPFRNAHARVGEFLGEIESRGLDLITTGDDERRRAFPELGDASPRESFEASVARRDVIGGTAPRRVEEQILAVDRWLDEADP